MSGVRSVTDTIGTFFDENETAQATRILRAMDPAFNVEGFHRELREYIIPEVIDAYLSADREALQAWCGEAVSDLALFCEGFGYQHSFIWCRHIMCCGQPWSST